jgi:hypothetical protein
MNTSQNPGWVTRILVTLVTTALVILGFFFLTVALIAGAIVAAIFGARLWWTLRKLKRAQANAAVDTNATVVDGDYRVIEHESAAVRLPPQP